ncbi:amidase domain-containing protein [Paenibacillus chartarius]|uniref:Amidase domain-containing protein n=1 Tax=Paenibacillus chartarius TaxID=747481 RepID=A0ABV6DSE8_9BACL
MSWKTAVYDYVHAKNRAEAELGAEPLRSVLTADPSRFEEHAKVLQAARQSAAARGLRLIEQKSRLRMKPLYELPDEAAAELEVHRTLTYEGHGCEYTEERVEREQVTVAPRSADERWELVAVQKLQPPDSYRPKPAAPLSYAAGWPESLPVQAALPYLNTSILQGPESSSRKMYNRAAAVQYAEIYWNKANPQYVEFEVDCTNFVSQCLFAGGLPMNYTGKRDSGWWYRGRINGQEQWSFSWAVAHSLSAYLLSSGRAVQVADARELRPGDVICYDWDGDGRFQHNTIITGMDYSGQPLVNAHTYNARGRFWAYHDSPAYSDRTAYLFLRISDRI